MIIIGSYYTVAQVSGERYYLANVLTTDSENATSPVITEGFAAGKKSATVEEHVGITATAGHLMGLIVTEPERLQFSYRLCR